MISSESAKYVLEKDLRKLLNDTYMNNPLKGTPGEGITLLSAATNFSEQMKSITDDELSSYGLDKSEFDKLIDNVVSEVLGEFVKF